MTPPDLQRWCIDAACRNTTARAAELTDQQDHEALVQLFAPDAVPPPPQGSS